MAREQSLGSPEHPARTVTRPNVSILPVLHSLLAWRPWSLRRSPFPPFEKEEWNITKTPGELNWFLAAACSRADTRSQTNPHPMKRPEDSCAMAAFFV